MQLFIVHYMKLLQVNIDDVHEIAQNHSIGR